MNNADYKGHDDIFIYVVMPFFDETMTSEAYPGRNKGIMELTILLKHIFIKGGPDDPLLARFACYCRGCSLCGR